MEKAQKCKVCGKPAYGAYRDTIYIPDEAGSLITLLDDPLHYLCIDHCDSYKPKKTIKEHLEVRDLAYLDYPAKANGELPQKHIYYWKRLLKNCLAGLEEREKAIRDAGEWVENAPWERTNS